MITQIPKIRVKANIPIGNDVFFALPDLSSNPKSYLEADVSAGVSSITANGSFLTAGQYLIIGQPTQFKAEIVKILSVTNTTITFSTSLIFPHNRGDIVTVIEYNQIEPSRSTDGGTSFSALTIIDINPQGAETYLQRTGDATTDVYKFRFYNSTTALYSGYSDPIVATGYADNSVYAIKQRALSQLGEKVNDLITDDFLNDALNEGRRIVDQDSRVFRWSFRTKFNTDIGNIIPGTWSVTNPTDLRDRNTNKNILSLRLGRNNRFVTYQDINRFNQNYLNIAHTTLNGAITTADTTITLTSSGDFDESGTIYIAGSSVSEVNDAVAYTANNESTNVISGVTGIVANKASGTDVWQNVNFGLPTYYTVNNGAIYFDVPFDNAYAGENIYMDYYQTLTPVNSDSDTIDEPFYDMYVPYLKYKIKYLKANGEIKAKEDTDYNEFTERIEQLIKQEIIGQNVYFIPNMNGFNGLRGLGRNF